MTGQSRNDSLVTGDKIIFPPLHTKLGHMKQFVKAFDKDGHRFQYMCSAIYGISIEKGKQGIFDGPGIENSSRMTTSSTLWMLLNQIPGFHFIAVVKNLSW